MNRQVRIKDSGEIWRSFGAVSHFQAVRQFVTERVLDRGVSVLINQPISVETRDEHDPTEYRGSLEVVPHILVEFLNPRMGAD